MSEGSTYESHCTHLTNVATCRQWMVGATLAEAVAFSPGSTTFRSALVKGRPDFGASSSIIPSREFPARVHTRC